MLEDGLCEEDLEEVFRADRGLKGEAGTKGGLSQRGSAVRASADGGERDGCEAQRSPHSWGCTGWFRAPGRDSATRSQEPPPVQDLTFGQDPCRVAAARHEESSKTAGQVPDSESRHAGEVRKVHLTIRGRWSLQGGSLMRIDARFGHGQVPFDTDFETHLVITLAGEESADAERPRLGIIPVLDRTGSMYGEKLRTATAALAHLCGFLESGDALGLVTFSETAETPLHPKPNQADMYLSALSEIRADGTTNLAAGLRRGVELGKALAREWAGTRFEIRVILISDGLANVGETSPEKIARIVSDLEPGVRVTAIGVGRDCDHDLLARIAGAGGGSYGFAEGSAAIPRLLGAEFGAALSIDATEIEVEVEPKNYIDLGAPLGVAAAKVRAGRGGEGWKISIPTLLAGETRHIVLGVTTRRQDRRHARRVSAAVVRVTDLESRRNGGGAAHGAGGEEGVARELRPKLFFSGKTETVPPTMVEAIDRAKAAEALARAETLAARGEYHMAATVLAQTSAALHTPGVAGSLRSASIMYNSAESYMVASAERSSLNSAMSKTSRLLGSSDAFDAAWSQTMGESYQTSAMRNVATETSTAVGNGSSGTTSEVTTGDGSSKGGSVGAGEGGSPDEGSEGGSPGQGGGGR